MSNYKTITKKTEGFLKDKGSKFYSYAFPIQNAGDVKALIEQVKEEHAKANHFCFAFLLQEGGEPYFICNDDGEPKNTAGMPILGQIKSFELSHVLVVVVRYFGGTKLGVSGLISAYKLAAKDALEKAETSFKEEMVKKKFFTNHENLGNCLAIIDKNEWEFSLDYIENGVYVSLLLMEEEIMDAREQLAALNIQFD